MLDSTTQTFTLVANTAKESNIFAAILVWAFIVAPLIGFVSWKAMTALNPNAASIIGGILGIVAIGTTIFFFVHKQRFVLTFTKDTVNIVNASGNAVRFISATDLKREIAYHEYVGRPAIRTTVLILRDNANEISIGVEPAPEPSTTNIQKVSAPDFIIEPAEFARIMKALGAH